MPEQGRHNSVSDVSASIEELMDRLRSRGLSVREVGSSLVAWVAVWLFVRWAEHEDRERQAIAAFDDEEYEPLFSEPDVLDKCLRANDNIGWMVQEGVLREVHRETTNPLRKRVEHLLRPDLLEGTFRPLFTVEEVWQWLATWVAPLDFSKHEDVQTASTMLDMLLADVLRRGDHREPFTPDPVADLIVDLADPKPGERIYDPCFGTGGLLLRCARRVREAARTCAAGDWDRLRGQTIFGVELRELPFIFGQTRIVLAGIPLPGLELGNTLARPQATGRERFDVVVGNLPWGGRVADPQIRDANFRFPSKDSVTLFVQHVMNSLRPEGRAVLAVPESMLFRTGADRSVREWLLKEFHVDGVISLPEVAFSPYTSVKSNLLVFQRSKPAEAVRFLRVRDLAGTKSVDASGLQETPAEVAIRFRMGDSLRRLRNYLAHWAGDGDSQKGITQQWESLRSLLASQPQETPFQSRTIARLTDTVESAEGEWDSLLDSLRSLHGDEDQSSVSTSYHSAEDRPDVWASWFRSWKEAVDESSAATGFSSILSRLNTADDSWSTPVSELRKRDYELIVKKSGQEELDRQLTLLCRLQPGTEIRPLAEVAEVTRGVSYSRQVLSDRRDCPESIGFLRVSDVRDGRVISPETYLVPKGQERLKPQQRVNPGDILVSVSGTIGKIGIVSDSKDVVGSAVAKSLFIVRPQQSLLHDYLAAILQAPAYQNWLRGHARGSTIQHLSIRTLRNLRVPVPELLVQERVVRDLRASGEKDVLAALMQMSARKKDRDSVTARASAQASELAARQPSRSKNSEPFAAVEEMAAVYSRLGAIAPDEPDDDIFPWWGEWKGRMRSLMGPLVGISEVTSGSALYALLVEAQRDLEGALRVLPPLEHASVDEDERQLLQRVWRLTDAASAPVRLAITGLLGTVRIEASLRMAGIPIGKEQDCSIGLRNAGRLPVRDVSFSTTPDLGGASIAYFGENEEKSITVRVPPQSGPGVLPFSLRWRCKLIDGSPAEGGIDLAMQVLSTRDHVHGGELGENPYVTGTPIDRDEMFFGRKDVIAEIKRQLSVSHRANVILLEGNRRSGKTSLLRHLEAGDMLPGWVPAYFSFQGGTGDDTKAGLPTVEIFRSLAVAVFKALCKVNIRTWLPGLPMPSSEGLAFRRDFIRAASSEFSGPGAFELLNLYLESAIQTIQPKKLLLLLDEFDKLQEGIDTGVTSSQLPENIRYILHEHAGVSAILSYSKLFRRLREEYWSMLFGLGYPVDLLALSEEEARQLVTRPTEGRLAYSDAARDRIVWLCSCQPYLIQSLCTRVFSLASEANERSVTESLVNKAAVAMAADSEHLATLWKHHVRSQRQRYILALFQTLEASGEAVSLPVLDAKLENAGILVRREQQIGDDLDYLRALELVTMDDGGSEYRLAVPLMGDWIRVNKDVEDQRRRAVRESEAEA